MNNIKWSSDSWFCSKPKVFPQIGYVPISLYNIRQVRLKRQIPYYGESDYNSKRYRYSKDPDPYKYVDRSYDHYDPYSSHSSSGYGSHSGYGHASYDSHDHDCCPLVVDPMTLCALLGLIAAATYFLRRAITMNMNIVGRRRKKRSYIEAAIDNYSSRMFTEDVNITNSLNSTYSLPDSGEAIKISLSYVSDILYQGKPDLYCSVRS